MIGFLMLAEERVRTERLVTLRETADIMIRRA
jgi:hypothetical protein